MITENLSSGTKCIPETIVISVPNSKDALLKCIESSNNCTKKYINLLRSSLRGDSSNALCKEDEIITYMYINPVNKSFYELIKKKNTASNSLLSRLVNSCWSDYSLSPIELKNEGWRIEKVLVRSEVINTSCRNPMLQGDSYTNDNYLIMVLSHPEMRNVIYSKFGYDINEYPNLYTVILVDNTFLSDYLNTFNKSFVYGNSFDTIRIVDIVVKDKACPSSCIFAKTEFIPEDYYKVNINTKRLDYAIKLGNIEPNLVSLKNKYIPGHIYRFQGNGNAFELLSSGYYYRGRSHYLLYIGRIDLFRYISTSRYRLIIRGLFTDIYDLPELNDWSRDIENLTKLGGSGTKYGNTEVNMCLNTPVDVFTVVGIDGDYSGVKLDLPGTKKSEGEYLDILTNKFNTSTGTKEVRGDSMMARFVVLPAIELTNDKRGHSLEIEVTSNIKKGVMCNLNERDLPTSYRIYQEVVDLGRYVDIISPTKIFMKKVILNIEGKNENNTYDLLKSLIKNLNNGGGFGIGAINLDSYNLFTREELQSLDKKTFNNLRNNLMDLIIKVLYAYCTKYAQSCFCNNTYTYSFTMNVFSPRFSDIKEGFLMRLQKSINTFWTGRKDRSTSAIYSNSTKSSIEDIIITELGKGKQEGDLTYNATGIFDTLEKYCITEKDLRQCTEFLN